MVTFTADLGQGEELEPARKKAEMFGVKEIFVDDLRETFVRDFVFPMFRANTLYEGQYLLGTSIARPLIAQRQIEIAEQVGADAVAHGATGKGNDQVRFELSYYALKPDIKIIAPVAGMGADQPHEAARIRRDSTRSRSPRTSAARRRSASMPTCCTPRRRGRSWKIRRMEADEIVYQRTIRPEDAPDQATVICDGFRARRPGGDRRRGAVAGRAADAAERAGQGQRHRPAGSGGEPLRRHEVARRLRDAGRHDPAGGASGDREHHAGPRGGASEGQPDAALCRADLQRLLVQPGAADAAGADRRPASTA